MEILRLVIFISKFRVYKVSSLKKAADYADL